MNWQNKDRIILQKEKEWNKTQQYLNEVESELINYRLGDGMKIVVTKHEDDTQNLNNQNFNDTNELCNSISKKPFTNNLYEVSKSEFNATENLHDEQNYISFNGLNFESRVDCKGTEKKNLNVYDSLLNLKHERKSMQMMQNHSSVDNMKRSFNVSIHDTLKYDHFIKSMKKPSKRDKLASPSTEVIKFYRSGS